MRTALTAMAVLLAVVAGAAAPEPEPGVFESPVVPAPESQIDKLVLARLSALGIQPALCSDAVFVRRAYLDVIGTLPTAKEAREFIQDPDTKNKRRLLIDRLLERDEFADYWAMKWGDILRIKAEFPVNLWPNAAQAYHRWVRASIAENKPYDKFAREMLTSSGSNFRVGPVNFYRAIQNRTPEGIAGAVALTFMGARAESWPKDQLAGMAAFFSQIGYKPTSEWKEENRVLGSRSRCARAQAATSAVGTLQRAAADQHRAAGGDLSRMASRIKLPPDRDPREVFADWLITPKNPWFTRSIVEPRLGLAAGARHHSRAGRYSRRQPAEQSRAAGLPGEGIGRRPLRPEAPLPADPELPDLSVFLRAPVRRRPGRGQLRQLPAAPAGGGGVDRRHQQDHRLLGSLHQRHPGAVHLHPGGQAGDRAGGWQHHQPVPGAVRTLGARHRHGERAQQQARCPPNGCTCSTRAISSASWNKAPSSRPSSIPAASRRRSSRSFT